MDNIIDIELTGRSTRRDQKLWQYDYGQVLRISGKEFPKVAEVQFSLQQSGGHTLDRIGTNDNGLLSVQIPNELLQNKGATIDYTIYAFVYLSGDGYGNTKYMIQLPVESRPEPTDPSEDPSIDPSIFKDAVNAVNASAERAETAEKSAKESADKAKKYADSAGKSKEYVEKARDNAISAIGTEKESALRGIESKTVESLQKIQSQTEESQNSIKQSIADATEKKTELDTSVGKAGEAKTALDSSIRSSEEKQLALDATVERANTVDASLKEQIGSAEQIQANVEQIAKNKADISSLNEDLSNKITKFYASNQGETHLADSDNGKIMDMMLYGRSEQKQYKGINLLPPDLAFAALTEVSIPKGTKIFAITDGTNFTGGSLRFFNADKTENMWFAVEKDTTFATSTLTIDAKYVQNYIKQDFDLSKMCFGIGNEPVYEPYVGGQPSPNPNYPQQIKSVVNPTVKVTSEDGLKVQSVTLNNTTLNAIPVSSDGNVTINGQQYVADYVDVERGKLVRMCKYKKLLSKDIMLIRSDKSMYVYMDEIWDVEGNYTSRNFGILCSIGIARLLTVADSGWKGKGRIIINNVRFTHIDQAKNYFDNNDVYVCYPIPTPEEIPITLEEVSAFKQLTTYYPVTNISVNSEQLDGYTVFNYPISMANGWNYVKQQLGDTRDYIYDMDAKAQDIDIQSAEAYVNSEYAVALTELEV